MGNYYAPFSLRISETLITKLKIIAIENKRSTNKEMEYALEKYVNEYEKAHGGSSCVRIRQGPGARTVSLSVHRGRLFCSIIELFINKTAR